MSMSKKDFIALADTLRIHNERMEAIFPDKLNQFTQDQIAVLADFCESQNSNFMRDRWLGYIAGENGKNGGSIKAK